MAVSYEIDSVDRKILAKLQQNARKPFLEVARDLKVSGGLIHQRYNRLVDNGVILGSQLNLNREALGYGVVSFIGIHLNRAQDCQSVIDKLKSYREVLEAHYTTGNYALIIKVATADVNSFYAFLMHELQRIVSIRSTESFIAMATPIERDIDPGATVTH